MHDSLSTMFFGDIDYREYFTEEMLLELRRAFDFYDVESDGVLAPPEIYQMFKRLSKPVTKAQVREVMNEVDIDNNGVLDFEECVILEIKMSRARPRADLIDYTAYLPERTIRQLEEWFSLNDNAEDGVISVESIMRILEQQQMHEPSEEFLEDLLRQVDPQGKGSLAFSAFCCFWTVLTRARKLINYREYFTSEQVESHRQLFAAYVTTYPKHITKQELDLLLRSLNIVCRTRQLNQIFQDFDTNRSGTLDFEEFCVLFLRLRGVRKRCTISPETCSCQDLWLKEGFTVNELLRSGFTLDDFVKAEIPVRKLYDAGEFSALELRQAGYSAADLRKGGVGLIELRTCGYTLSDLRLGGFSAAALLEANRSLQGSISSGNLKILPSICPRPLRSKHSFRSASLDVLKNGDAAQGTVQPYQQGWVTPEMRQMTPVIREHTDWRQRHDTSPLAVRPSSRLPTLEPREKRGSLHEAAFLRM